MATFWPRLDRFADASMCICRRQRLESRVLGVGVFPPNLVEVLRPLFDGKLTLTTMPQLEVDECDGGQVVAGETRMQYDVVTIADHLSPAALR